MAQNRIVTYPYCTGTSKCRYRRIAHARKTRNINRYFPFCTFTENCNLKTREFKRDPNGIKIVQLTGKLGGQQTPC